MVPPEAPPLCEVPIPTPVGQMMSLPAPAVAPAVASQINYTPAYPTADALNYTPAAPPALNFTPAAPLWTPFSGMYEDGLQCSLPPGQEGAEAKPEAAPSAPAIGLDSYKVVPDDFVGPLLPGTIRQSQYDDLKQFDFDKFNVVGDDFVGPLKNDQMTQQQFQQLTGAWLNVRDGNGMNISGSAADQLAFKKMLRATLGDSPTMRGLLSDIGNDTDPAHRIQANVGRSQARTFVDMFSNDNIDLNDIEQFPVAPGAASQNEMTQGEQLVHILGERRSALTSADPSDYEPAHAEATRLHNQYRAERGQAAELDCLGTLNAGGTSTVTMRYADGTQQQLELDRHSDIVSMKKPVNPKPVTP
jgi:hypothetical protein